MRQHACAGLAGKLKFSTAGRRFRSIENPWFRVPRDPIREDTKMTTAIAFRPTLDSWHRTRCDRCTAFTMVQARLASGSTLSFCQHHANEHESVLVAAGADLFSRPTEAF
jgi:hypothetical protein